MYELVTTVNPTIFAELFACTTWIYQSYVVLHTYYTSRHS